jgi:Ca2+-binding RTX toxin-like protein
LRELTYGVSTTPPAETLHRKVAIELSDIGNRIARTTLQLDQIVAKPSAEPAPTVLSSGSANKIIIGTASDDLLVGGKGRDTLSGHGGDDRLWGKAGNDVLTGGSGQDVFVFDTRPNRKSNIDRIKDFSVRDDAIQIDNAAFKTIGKGSITEPAKLAAKAFWKGAKAYDGSDRLIYNPKTGVLLYDADGTGRAEAVKIAILSKHLKLSAADFFVI